MRTFGLVTAGECGSSLHALRHVDTACMLVARQVARADSRLGLTGVLRRGGDWGGEGEDELSALFPISAIFPATPRAATGMSAGDAALPKTLSPATA
jgi:hypothetical protein